LPGARGRPILQVMRTTLLFALLAAGCATHGSDGRSLDEKTELEHAKATQPAPPDDPAIRKTTGTPGVIPRAELDQVLSASPGAFLQHVDSEPKFQAGKFAGWKLVTFFPGDGRFAGVDLHAGDVVKRVNGNTVERPEQLMQVWQELKSSKELVVDIERDGRPRTLRWTIAP
jgi:type II secretory pathway component PulC